jgi:photosystem II stability/assembly factor-like uncharacterized protein
VLPVPVTVPPRSTDGQHDSDLARRVADLEALIEEARQRARRRRRLYGAFFLLVALAAGGVRFGFHDGGGGLGSPAAQAGSAGGVAASAGSTVGRWAEPHGPYGGSAFSIAAAPSAPATVYLGTRGGVFASSNGGASWHNAGLPAAGSLGSIDPRVVSIAVDPHAPATVFAARTMWENGGLRQELFKTTNGGQSWRTLNIAAQRVMVSPTEPATVYAIGGSLLGTNRLFRSTDGGGSWRPVDTGLAATHFFGVAFDPTVATVYAATGLGVLKSTDGGSSWQRETEALSRQEATAVAVDPSNPQILYAGVDGGVIKSIDGGTSWRVVNAVLGSHGRDRWYGQVSSFVVDPAEPQTVYATTICAGIFKSVDGGRTWRAVSAAKSLECADSALSLVTHRSNALLGVVPGRGVFKSTDAAAHWQPADTGLDLMAVRSVAVDPDDPRTVYASSGSLGLFSSNDGGASWRQVARGVVNAVALDPRDPNIGLAAEAMHKVIRSSDGGRIWQPSGAGIAVTPTALAVGGGYAYAATFARGLYTSTDGGRSWRQPVAPLNTYGEAVANTPDDPAVVYAGGGPMNARGLYKSINAGQSWQRLTDPVKHGDISAIALDPKDPTTIYLGTAEGTDIYKSNDAGATWQPARSGLPHTTAAAGIRALVIDPAHPTTLYAATNGKGVFRSTDASSTWRPFNAGLHALDITSLTIDKTGQTLYAGTEAGVAGVRLKTR